MKQNLFWHCCKICLKCKIPKFEVARVNLVDFTSAESWTILTRKKVVQIALSRYHVTTSADVMLGTQTAYPASRDPFNHPRKIGKRKVSSSSQFF